MPIIFCLLILFCIWLTYERKKLSRMEENAKEAFLTAEKKAARSRKRDLGNLDYITIPVESLPIQKGTDDAINDSIDALLLLSKIPIVNLSNFSNTELKLQYGAANFKLLCEYDDNYHSLIRLLADWGSSLYEVKKTEQARQVLEYALSIGSDIKASIYTLATIYAEEENEDCIQHLKSHILKHIPANQESMLAELEKIRFHQYFA